MYSGGVPELIDGDVFKTIVPLSKSNYIISDNMVTPSDHVSDHDERLKLIIEFCAVERTRDEMQQHLGITHKNHFRQKILNPLLDAGKLRMTIPDKPKSRSQKYIRA